MKVRDLVAALLLQDQDAELGVAVGWATDSAVSEPDEIKVVPGPRKVTVRGWLSDCDAELTFVHEDEPD